MTTLENNLNESEKQLIALIKEKGSNEKERNYKCNIVYRSFDSLRKVMSSLEKEKDVPKPVDVQQKKTRERKQKTKPEPQGVCFAH